MVWGSAARAGRRHRRCRRRPVEAEGRRRLRITSMSSIARPRPTSSRTTSSIALDGVVERARPHPAAFGSLLANGRVFVVDGDGVLIGLVPGHRPGLRPGHHPDDVHDAYRMTARSGGSHSRRCQRLRSSIRVPSPPRPGVLPPWSHLECADLGTIAGEASALSSLAAGDAFTLEGASDRLITLAVGPGPDRRGRWIDEATGEPLERAHRRRRGAKRQQRPHEVAAAAARGRRADSSHQRCRAWSRRT